MIRSRPRATAQPEGPCEAIRTIQESVRRGAAGRTGGRAVAVGSWHRKAAWGEVRLIDVDSKRVVATPWEKARLWCENVAFSHDGRTLAVSTSRDIMLWRIEVKDEEN